MTFRHDKLASQLQRLVAEFLDHHRQPGFLITVTAIELKPDERLARAGLTIWPAEAALRGLGFARRLGRKLSLYIRERLPRRLLPKIELVLDNKE